MRTPALLLSCLALLALALGGCGRASESTAPAPVEPPPASAAEVVRQLERAWNERDTTRVRSLLTDDFQFVFGSSDSAGNGFRTAPWTAVEELRACRNLFVGGSAQPPASRITLRFDPTLIAIADDRPGRTAAAHKSVYTAVNLTIQIVDGDNRSSFEVQGNARFYLVRGDPAQTSGSRDASRWWMARWEELTLPSGAQRSLPSQSHTRG